MVAKKHAVDKVDDGGDVEAAEEDARGSLKPLFLRLGEDGSYEKAEKADILEPIGYTMIG